MLVAVLDALPTEELARGCFTDGIWCGWRHNAVVRGIGVSMACLVVPRMQPMEVVMLRRITL